MLKDQLSKVNELSFQINKTKDEKERETLEDQLQTILVDIKKDAINSFKGESDLKNFLDNIIRFNNYSYNNQLLIWLQNPNAKYICAMRTFNQMGYSINKGEEGIKILIPNFYNIVKIKLDGENNFEYKPLFALSDEELEIYKDKNNDKIVPYKKKLSNFKIGNVFDATQTNMPLSDIEEQLDPVLEDDRAETIKNIFIKAIYRSGFKVEYKDFTDTTAKGYCDHKNKTIVLRKGLSNLMELKVLIHEYGHALAHQHLENNHLEYEQHRNRYETEAESISYVVCKYLGLDTSAYSNMYLYSWSKDKDFKEIDDSLNTIVNYSKMIINNYKTFYNKELNLDIKNIIHTIK